MQVCIAEKPSVAKEIAQILGANIKRDGYFEGNGYIVTYTFGHLCRLQEPHDYKPHWKFWNLNNLPMLPDKFSIKVAEDSGIQKQFSIVKKLFENAETVINCGDAGQEGELIQRWVLKEAGYSGPVKRLWISSLTTEAIKDGFANLVEAENYDSLYYAGFSRAIGDWLLGMNATRLYTLKYGGQNQVLSIGRVQTPTLAMVVQRFHEIENFKPQPYWELQTSYRDVLFSYEEGRFLKKEEGEKVAKQVQEAPFEIVKISKKNGKEYAPKLFDLTGLQVYCNTKFGLTADETLKTVQKLYEQKLVTYPRVDTTFLPSDLYPKVKGILQNLKQYQHLTNELLNKPIKKSSKVFNDKKVTDHHAIIPTGVETQLGGAMQQVYDIITKRFIAVFYNDCKVAHTNVQGKAADILFKTSGKEILEKGWRIVFEQDSKKSATTDILPTFTKGEHGPHTPSFLEKKTKAPNQFTEASLLRAMETAGKQVDDDEMRDLMKENGIGRPSTRASIIETLFKRNYINRNKKQILPTSTGVQLIATINNELLKSAELTGQWEKRLKEIERGEFSASLFIKQMKKMVDDLIYEVRMEKNPTRISYQEIKKQQTDKKKASGIIGKACPKCNSGKILKGSSAYGCSQYKEGCAFKLPFKVLEKTISEKQYLRLLKKGSTVKLKGFKQNGVTVDGTIIFDGDFIAQLKPMEKKAAKVVSDKINCPKCSKGTVLKGKLAFGCSNFKEGCDFRLAFEDLKIKANGTPISKELVYKIISESKG
ncbi:DNA topoisomerase 3 [Urechidicola sp. KH5]